MNLQADYGTTPLPLDEVDYLLPEVRKMLGTPILRRDIYLIEQGLQEDCVRREYPQVLAGQLSVPQLLTSHYLRYLHAELFGKMWSWAGKYRRHELNLGVAPEVIATEVHTSLDNILHRWEHTHDFTARQLGIAVHAELVRVHPFVDGNGRSTRLLADLVFIAAQGKAAATTYDWNIDKPHYIKLLREYDVHRNPADLAEFIPLLA
jgi:fido (protein-threonine AMPylation protein)